MAAWLDEKCDRDPNGWTSSTLLFGSWARWATAAGEFIGSQKRLSQKLEDRGFAKKDTNKAKGFMGLRLIPDEHPAPQWGDQ